MQSSEWLHSQLLQRPPVRRSVEVPSIEPAKDGYVGISMVTGQQWLDFAAMVDCPEFTEIAQLRFQIGRWDYRDWIRERIDPWMRERTVEEIVELGQLFRLPLAPLGNGATIPDMDHLRARGVYVENPAGFRQPRAPWLMSAAGQAPVRAAPAVGEADGVLGLGGKAIHATGGACGCAAGRRAGRGLHGVLGRPAATHALAAFGADVIKIESIQRPDGIRYSGGMRTDVDDWWEYGWVFHAMNTNKRSVTLDLQSEDGLAAGQEARAAGRCRHRELLAAGDGAVRPGRRRVARTEPGALVVVRMPAFGLSGPWRDRVGFAPTMEQIAGLAWVTGLPDGPPVAPRGACDPLAGAHAAFATLTALEFARRTGRGQLVEIPMIETVLNVTAVQTMEFEVLGSVMERRGNRGHTTALQDVYRCAGEDDWIAVSVRSDDERGAVAELIGADRWRHRTVVGRPELRGGRRNAGTSRHTGGSGHFAVTGDRESAVGSSGLLRAARASADRRRSLSVPAVRSPRRCGAMAASHTTDAGTAQRRGADGAVRADRERPRTGSPSTASSVRARKVHDRRQRRFTEIGMASKIVMLLVRFG